MNEPVQEKSLRDRIIKTVVIIICILLIPMLIVNLTLIVKSFVYPDEVPSFLGYKPLIVLSGSMEPVFYSGDLVLVHEVNQDTLREGDIVAFREGNSIVTHRIQAINVEDEQRQYITKGDNNNTEDRITVTDEKIEGIYILKVSGLGNLAFFMQTPLGMILFIALPLLLFILYDIFRRNHYDRKEKSRVKDLEDELDKMRQQIASTENDEISEGTEVDS